MPASRSRDVAIIGIACRLPGAGSPDAFWNNLIGGVESITLFSDEELLAAGEDPALIRHPDYVKAAPILDGHDGFDAAFFGYSPREARLMDPQQRLFLEIAWAAFEDAGYDPLGENGAVGVYAGAGGLVSSYLVRHDHPELRGQTGDLGHIGNDRDFMPSRVAFKLDLTGPAVNVQTACSTSLVAVHLACQSLHDGEAEMALAGASVVRVPHIRGYLAEPGGIYSRDGHCRAFDAAGSGTLFGSGVAAVLLKPLAAALMAGDRIYAVIKGSAVTNDGGRKVNYTASTASGQARAMTEALVRAAVEPDSIGYVECHGTATALGDPLEIQALTRAFRSQTQRTGFCPVGSVKSNLGHLEQCAGLAGLIKAVLALDRGVIPPSLHFATPNPRIPFARSPFFVNTQPLPFARAATPRRAAVNSVGMGGTNAFVVLEEAPEPAPRTLPKSPVFALALSAKGDKAMAEQVANFRAALAGANATDLADICSTADRGRHHFDHRFWAVGADRGELLRELDRFRTSLPSKPGSITYLYSGQGTQYPRMGEALYRTELVYRRSLDRCLALFEAERIALAPVLFGDDDTSLTRTLFAQPALFSLQIALAELWAAWGIMPDTVIGHSIGEFAAAVAAGVCTVDGAARLVAARARLMEDLPERGAMASIGADLDRVRALWPEPNEKLAIAAENAPDRTVVAGSAAALAVLAERCHGLGIPLAELKTSHAFHSPLMEPILEAFEEIAATVDFRSPQTRWISTLTGAEMTEAPDGRYWRDQIRNPVRFRSAIESAAKVSGVFLEIGPGATLTALGRRSIERGGDIWLTSLTGHDDDRRSMLDALGEFYREGRAICWDAVTAAEGRRISLPTYPFQHERSWIEQRPLDPPAATLPSPAEAAHPLLGQRLGGGGLRYEALLDLRRFTYLRDHRVFGRAVLPTAAILDAVMAAAEDFGFSRPTVVDFVYELALAIPDDRPVWTQISFEREAGRASFRVESIGVAADDAWRLHVTGTLRDEPESALPAPFPAHLAHRGEEVPVARFYRFLDQCGLCYGPAFRGLEGLWRSGDEVFAKVELPAGLDGAGYRIHPAFLDACLHVYASLVHGYGLFDGETPVAGIYVPISIDAFQLYRTGIERGWVHATVIDRDDDEERLKIDIRAYAEDGKPVALWRGLTVRRVADDLLATTEGAGWERLLYTVDWREAPHTEPALLPARRWCIVSDAAGEGECLAKALEAAGYTAMVLAPEAVTQWLWAAMPDEPVGLILCPGPVPSGAPEMTRAVEDCLLSFKALDRVRDRFREPPRLWLATRGARDEIGHSPLWGLGRTFALEYPEMWGGVVDVSSDTASDTVAALVMGELGARDGEDQIALRSGRRLVPRLVRLATGIRQPSPGLCPEASYWIIGGLGRLGLATAAALIEAGARHLVLTGRNGPDEPAAAALNQLGAKAQVLVVPADIGSATEIDRALADIRAAMPPLKGIIHAAAVFEDALLANASPDQFERVLRPKVAGAWHLHRATLGLDLDFFVLFSSVLGLWGAAGQGAYAAANSFLDALAGLRRAAGLPATVFNWGPWSDAGRWGKVGAAMWQQRGTAALKPDTCLEILLSFLHEGPAQIVVTETNWPDFLNQFSEPPALYRELAPPHTGVASSPDATCSVAEDTVAWHVGQVLGMGGKIDPMRPLNELGLDSLLAVTLANRLRQALDIAVPTALLLKGPSIKELAAELLPEAAREPENAKQVSNARIAGDGWLIIPQPNPEARARLFAFPFAGGGAATFRPWAEHLDRSIELVAIEPPGRQTRIDETPICEFAEFLRRLVPELLPFLDRPYAVYGHCLGALTLFETVRRLIGEHRLAPEHVFVSGARTPDELHRHQEFEESLMERLLQLPGYNLFEPIHRQPDEVFAEAIRRFNVVATESLVQEPELRRLILPAIRAEFEMSSNYCYVPEPAWDVPITCFTGSHDAYVLPENAGAWRRFTKKRFQLFTLESEHFIVVDDDRFLLRVINRELASPL